MAGPPLLIGYEGSNAARRALCAAAHLFPGARAVIAHVEQPLPPGVTEAMRQEAAVAVVDEGVELASREGLQPVPATTHAATERGVAGALIEQAAAHDAEVIVVAAGERSLIDRALLGSVSEKLVHASDRPVLVVPDGAG